MRSGSVPATQAAVATARPAAAPQTTAASSIAGEPRRVAMRLPAARSSAGRST